MASSPRPRPAARRPATMRWWLALAAALLALLGGPHQARAQTPEEDPGLEQTIDADQELVTGPAVLDAGHVDIGPRWVAGEWTLLLHDDAEVPSVWRQLDDVVLQVRDEALLTAPDDPTYDFLGVEPGAQVHVIPQVEAPGVVWVGWNTQDPEVLERIDLGATLTMRRVQGPGSVTMYLQSGNLGDPEVLWDSREDQQQPIWVETNTHTHANWVFSEPGTYLVEVEVSADLVDGEHVSDVRTLRFAVGDTTSVDDARTAAWTTEVSPDADEAEPDDAEQSASSEDDGGGGRAVVLLAVVGGAALLLAGVAFGLARGARAKRQAEASRRRATSAQR